MEIDHEIISTVILLPSANIQAGLFVSYKRKYELTACLSLPRKNVVKWTDRPAMTIAVDMGRKATKTNKQEMFYKLFYRKKIQI